MFKKVSALCVLLAAAVATSNVAVAQSSATAGKAAATNAGTLPISSVSFIPPTTRADNPNVDPFGYFISGQNINFFARNATWADVHYVLGTQGQQNFRMAHDASNNNTFTVNNVPNGTVVRYFLTISNNNGGAFDTPWVQFTMNGGGTTTPPPSQPLPDGVWNKMTTFNIVNNTRGRFPDSQVYWAIIGRDTNTNQFVHVDAQGRFIPMTPADNNQLFKNGQGYSNYFQTIAQARSVTIPPINSARLFLSVGSPMFLKVLIDGAGNVGYAGADIENPTDPNIDVYFDFVEMAIIPTQGFFGNTTRVDSFGFPVTLRVQGLGGFDQIVGETETRDALFASYQASVPNEFKALGQAPYAPFRIVAPAKANFKPGLANGNYLANYINGLWNRYRTDTLTFTIAQGTFSGNVVGNTFQFTDGQGIYRINGIPTTSMALLGNGLLSDASGTTPGTPAFDKQLQIQAQLCAAINRRVVETPSQWRNSAAFYPAGLQSNAYAKFWHDHNIRGLAYGFAYDDVSDFSSSIFAPKPAIATVTVGF